MKPPKKPRITKPKDLTPYIVFLDSHLYPDRQGIRYVGNLAMIDALVKGFQSGAMRVTVENR